MKSLIVYYSFTGNTEKVAGYLSKILKTKGEVTTEQLVPIKETKNFFMQCLQARLGRKIEISGDISYNVSGYDLICIGTPVWAFAPTPAIDTYLDRLSGGAGKKAVIFTTYGSGAGVRGCVNAIKRHLSEKGISIIKEFNIQMGKVNEGDFVEKEILNLEL